MISLKAILSQASREGWAVGHFNFSTLEMLRAVVEAAANNRSPLLVGTSEKERNFIGLRQAVALIKSFRDEFDLPLYLNADHSFSFESAKKAVDAGYDSIHIDLSKMTLEDNIKSTREVVRYVKEKNPDISVEGELGYLVTDSSKVYRSVVEVPEESLVRLDEAERFVKETGVDRLAAAVGSIHGIAANEPHLDFDRIAKLRSLLPDMVLVLHGGSGVPKDQIEIAVSRGIGNIHISTDLRVAYVKGLREALNQSEEVAPYKLLAASLEEIKKVVTRNVALFGSKNRV